MRKFECEKNLAKRFTIEIIIFFFSFSYSFFGILMRLHFKLIYIVGFGEKTRYFSELLVEYAHRVENLRSAL